MVLEEDVVVQSARGQKLAKRTRRRNGVGRLPALAAQGRKRERNGRAEGMVLEDIDLLALRVSSGRRNGREGMVLEGV